MMRFSLAVSKKSVSYQQTALVDWSVRWMHVSAKKPFFSVASFIWFVTVLNTFPEANMPHSAVISRMYIRQSASMPLWMLLTCSRPNGKTVIARR